MTDFTANASVGEPWFEGKGEHRRMVVPVRLTQEVIFKPEAGGRIGKEVREEHEQPAAGSDRKPTIRIHTRTTRTMTIDETFEMAAADSQSFAHGGVNDGCDMHRSWRPRTGSGATGRGSSYEKTFDDGSTWATLYRYSGD